MEKLLADEGVAAGSLTLRQVACLAEKLVQ